MSSMRNWAGLAVLLAAAAGGMTIGFWTSRSLGPAGIPRLDGEIPLQATGVMATDRFAVATGAVDDEVEGLFVLDFLTGELQCRVLNVRTAKFSSVFRTNVLPDLGATMRKNARFALAVGDVSFERAGRVSRVGRSVAYVVDPETGSYAAYIMPWRPEFAQSGRQQSGALVLLDSGRITVPAASPAP